ncbi:hypothetical protein PISMIDRAFT_680745 [Pisolithus microcarpus 441]|uniref:Uncharacterized protein n=1 Tax=Pisolithus microcarpus 441 TaxID=765257 RepID=A0A0C9YZ26_9AGAM|nr:hypothetical protein PISMIDRAFT_680745 [Pisolithus microcarpus 441]
MYSAALRGVPSYAFSLYQVCKSSDQFTYYYGQPQKFHFVIYIIPPRFQNEIS